MNKILYFLSLLLLNGTTVEAGPIVRSNVTPIGGGLFHFDFSVTNNTINDIVLVSIDAPSGDSNIGATLSAPVGYLALYDSGLGLINFYENTDLFAVGTTKNGFSFDSAFGLESGEFSHFTALTLNGDTLTGNIETTLVNVVLEPHTALLLALGVTALVGSRMVHQSKSRLISHNVQPSPRRPD